MAAFFHRTHELSCGCWREIPKDQGKPRNIFISGWILLALATINERGTSEEIRFLLEEQHPDGWWSVFPVDESESQFASTYGTAWALLGLNSQLKKNFVDNDDKLRVVSAIGDGANWLIEHRERNLRVRWKDYQLLSKQKSTISESISGVVLHTLHQSIQHNIIEQGELQQIDSDWLDNLPAASISIEDKDQPHIWFKDKDCHWCQDGFTQIKLPWLLIATADAYANGSLLQRVKALSWIEQVLAQDGVTNSDTEPDNWWRAEVLYALSVRPKRY
jgi:hypothetical protein